MSLEFMQMLNEFSDSCLRCGLCAQTDCGNFSEGTPNLGEICESLLEGDETWRHFPFTCALCNRCTTKCPASLHAADMCKPARAYILPKHPELRPLYRKFRTDLKYNLFNMLQSHRAYGDMDHIQLISGEPNLGGAADHTAFFPGCSLFAYAPELTAKVSEWLREEKLAAYTLTFCCGASFYDPGFFEEFDAYKKTGCDFLRKHKIEHLIITCPHCEHLLPEFLEGTGIDLIRLPELLESHDKRAKGKLAEPNTTLTFHDACYDRDKQTYGALARKLYSGANIKEMQHSKRETMCCGGGGMVSVYARSFCEYRRLARLAEVDATGANACLSTCFSCVNSMQRSIREIPVRHYLEEIFDTSINWSEVYASVDALYADERTEGLYESFEPLFEGQLVPDEPVKEPVEGAVASNGAPKQTASNQTSPNQTN